MHGLLVMLEAALPHVWRSDGVGHCADHSSSLNFAGRGIQATALLCRLVRQVGRLFATSRVVLLHIELLGAVEGAVWHMIASSSHMLRVQEKMDDLPIKSGGIQTHQVS